MADTATTTTEPPEPTTTAPADTGGGKTEEPLGDAGISALRQERERANKAEREAREHKAAYDKLVAENSTDQEKAITKAREEAREEALKETRVDRVKDKLEVKAAGKLADPTDAARYLDPEDFIGKDGSIDDKAMAKAIDDLVKERPHLAAGGGKSRTGSGDGGARGGGGAGESMNDVIRRRMGR